MKAIIHVHQQRIKKGLDALICRTYKGSTHHRRIDLSCPDCGTHVATLEQHEQPDRCGARVWIDVDTNSVSLDRHLEISAN